MRQARIMLVEDEKVVAADIEECIAALGYEVAGSAASGAEALRLAEKTKPDLVLMDIKLRGAMDGIEVTAILHERYRIPVVYLTAHADAEILERAKRTAPSGYVLKPFDERALRTAIEMAFERHHRERALVEGGERLTAAIGSIDEGVIVTQTNGKVAVMNRVAEMLTGWRQEEAVGKALGDVFTLLGAANGAPQPSPAGRVLREGISVALGEGCILLSRQGFRHRIQGSAAPVRNGTEQAVGVCLLFRAAGQRARDEQWGAAEHLSSSRMETLGYLTAAVASEFSTLLPGQGNSGAVRLANRLLEFGERQLETPRSLAINAFVTGIEDLMQCALGGSITLSTKLDPAVGSAQADPGQIEMLLMHLAMSARNSSIPGRFALETSLETSQTAGDGYAVIAIRPPGGSMNAATDLPALDEIVRQSAAEIRVTSEEGIVRIYLPAIAA